MTTHVDPVPAVVVKSPVGQAIPFARIALALGIALIVLQFVKKFAPGWAWLYVAAILMGLILAQRGGVNTFLTQVKSRL